MGFHYELGRTKLLKRQYEIFFYIKCKNKIIILPIYQIVLTVRLIFKFLIYSVIIVHKFHAVYRIQAFIYYL